MKVYIWTFSHGSHTASLPDEFKSPDLIQIPAFAHLQIVVRQGD